MQSYPVLLGLGFCAFLGILKFQERFFKPQNRIPFETWVNVSFAGLIFSLIGARIFYFLVENNPYQTQEISFWKFWEGGLVFYGGLLAGLPFLWLFLPRNHIPRPLGFDLMAPALALGHSFGRVGCFLNGCCYGSFCDFPWAVTYTSPLTVAERNVPLHPVQIYEAVFLLFLSGLLIFWNFFSYSKPRNPYRPSSTTLYFVIYGIFRFFNEFLRADPGRGFWGPFSTSQWVSILIFTLGLGIYAYQVYFPFDLKPQGDFKAKHESPSRKP